VGFCQYGLASPEDDERTNEAMPSLLLLMAATQSAFPEKPHARQTTSLCDLRLSLAECSQLVRLALLKLREERDSSGSALFACKKFFELGFGEDGYT
jgi:hypothetical protein